MPQDMSIQRLTLFVCLLLCWAGQTFADKLGVDPWGNVYRFWLTSDQSTREVKFSRSITSTPQTLFTFSQEVTAFDVSFENDKFFLVYISGKDNNIYFTASKDKGLTFSKPLLVSNEAANPSLALSHDKVCIAWEQNDGISFVKSEDQERTVSGITFLNISNEVLSSPNLLIDESGNPQLCFLAKSVNLDTSKVMFTQLASPEPKAIFSGQDEISNLGMRFLNNSDTPLVVFWQNQYSDRLDSYYAVSLDQGNNFSTAKGFYFNEGLFDISLMDNSLSALGYNEHLVIQEIEQATLQPPNIIFPVKNTVLNSASAKISYTLPSPDPIFCKIELVLDGIGTRNFTQLVLPARHGGPAGQEISTYFLPKELTEGAYKIKIHSYDGLSTSQLNETAGFLLDNTAPRFTTLEAKRVGQNAVFTGRTSESPARLTIKEKSISLETVGSFECQLPLKPGQNRFTLILRDEADNTTLSTQEITYNPASPEITVVQPQTTDWFKPQSIIFIKARVLDVQEDIAEDCEASLTINNNLLANTLAFDREESTLSGFISLPDILADGVHTGTITITDISGNRGQAVFTINIDGSPPQLTQAKETPCFTNSETQIPIPFVDLGTGLDTSGTTIQVSGISVEGITSLEGETIIFVSGTPLPEGSYEVEVTPRDLVGNVGKPIALSLIVDTTAPQLTLSRNYGLTTNEDRLLIEGTAYEVFSGSPLTANIYINKNLVNSFNLTANYFSKEIKLISGSNQILVEVVDKAGNKAETTFSLSANFDPAAKLIEECVHGPNPFSPRQSLPGAFSARGEGMVFAYSLAKPADIKIRIFDITGTQIWVKQIPNASSGVTAWSGADAFGQIVGSGVYPFIFSASSGGHSEMKKGKIIVNQ